MKKRKVSRDRSSRGSEGCRVERSEVVSICFNRECLLRKKVPCKGWEGCPGYRGRP